VARTYYPGTANLSEAERVTLTAGLDATNLDFGLLGVPMAQVTITVLDSSGKPPAAVATRVQRLGAPPGEVRGILAKNQAMFPAVPAGEFWMMAAATPAPGARPEYAIARTTVAGSDARLTLQTSPALTLPGRVVPLDASLAPPSFAGVQVRAESVGIELPNPAGSAAPPPPPPAVSQDGSFVLDGIFGPMLFRLAGLPAGWALMSVRLGEREIIDIPLDLAAADPAPEGPLTMVVTNTTGEITGSAIDARKQPVPNARIVLYPDDETQWQPASRFIRGLLASADGTFSMSSLLPGRYLVAAVEWMDNGAWLDPDTLRRLRAFARPVVVEPHAKSSVTVTVGGGR